MAVGVYLGLILRYNSWDLVHRPAEVWAAVAHLRFRPDLSLALFLFGGFLWLVYLAADVRIDGLQARRSIRSSPGSGRPAGRFAGVFHTGQRSTRA